MKGYIAGGVDDDGGDDCVNLGQMVVDVVVVDPTLQQRQRQQQQGWIVRGMAEELALASCTWLDGSCYNVVVVG